LFSKPKEKKETMDYFLASEKIIILICLAWEKRLLFIREVKETSFYVNTNSTGQKCTHLWSNINNTIKSCKLVRGQVKGRGGHAQHFFESAFAIPQPEGSTSAIAIPQRFKEMLLRNRNSAIRNHNFF
jgi:hypothetical protein